MYRTALCIAGLVCQLVAGAAAGFEHPGGFHTVAQLADVRARVAAGTEPWATAYDDLQQLVDAEYGAHTPSAVAVLCVAPLGQVPLPGDGGAALKADGRAAYLSALMYQLEPDPVRRQAYAETARSIVTAWATTMVDLRSAETTGERDACGDTPLVMTTSGTGLILAAELLSTYVAWNGAERGAFRRWVRELMLKKAALLATYKTTNHRDWAFFATLAANHFLDDEGLRNPELTSIAHEIDELQAWIDGRIIEGPIGVGAMSSEIGRGREGLWYSYFALNPLTSSIQLVYNATGENLYVYNGGRVKAALDYLLYYCQNPAEWPHYSGPDLRDCDSAYGGEAWPRNLFEAMGEIYQDGAMQSYVGGRSPMLYPQAHHVGWHVPGLMRPSLAFPNGGRSEALVGPPVLTPSGP